MVWTSAAAWPSFWTSTLLTVGNSEQWWLNVSARMAAMAHVLPIL
jgi:hypothetical protein